MENEIRTKLDSLSDEELIDLKDFINGVLNSRKEKQLKRFLFDPSGHFERYNGGWTKTVDGLNKESTNGFSILGEFKPNKTDWYTEGKVYLDKGIGGSRKNQRCYYFLFTFDTEGNVIILKETTGKNWAVNLWETIEKNLGL